MSVIGGLRSYYEEFGLGGVLSIAKHRLTGRNKRIRVQIDGIEHPITLRLRTSDHRIFRDIFQRHEYLFIPPTPPEFIVDAGANIGLASIYFANRWPYARIVAIEPDPENFKILRRNVRPYPNIIPVQAAVWKENTRLNLFDPGGGAWAVQTKTDPDGCVQGLTLPEVMRRYGLPRVDILKVDIEGAEKEVFEHHTDWLDRVGSIAVETHEHFKFGSHDAVMHAAKNFKFIYYAGSTWFLLREVVAQPEVPAARKGYVMG